MKMELEKVRPSRILMTVDTAGGIWRYALDLAAGLSPLGIDTVFACFGPTPGPSQIKEAESIGKLIVCHAPLDWMVADEASLKQVPSIIAGLIDHEDIDLLHLNLPSQAACLDIDVPVVVVAHSCVCTWFEAVRGHVVPEGWRWQLDLNRLGFDRADAVLMPSESHAALSQKVYGPIGRLHVVHNATRASLSLEPKCDYVFAAGRWWDDGKNSVLLDKAAPSISWPVVLVGPNRGACDQFVPLHNVQYRGELSHQEALALMRDAAVFVSPSIYEPFGLAVLEAARCGCSLVLSDISTYRELWDGAALFANPYDPKSFAEVINRLADDHDLQEVLGGRAAVRSEAYRLERQVQAVAAIYQRLLSSTRAPQTRRAAE